MEVIIVAQQYTICEVNFTARTWTTTHRKQTFLSCHFIPSIIRKYILVSNFFNKNPVVKFHKNPNKYELKNDSWQQTSDSSTRSNFFTYLKFSCVKLETRLFFLTLYFVQTTQVSSCWCLYGGQGREPQPPCTGYIRAPFLSADPPGMNWGDWSTHTYSLLFFWPWWLEAR